MNIELIEKYLRLAESNWYKKTTISTWIKSYKKPTSMSHKFMKERLISIIMSKQFLEAITKGLQNTAYQNTQSWVKVDIDVFTEDQAIAIRDNKLEDFISSLWIWKI